MKKRLNVLIGLLLVLAIVLVVARDRIQIMLLEWQLDGMQEITYRGPGQVWEDLIQLDPDNVEYRLRRVRWLMSRGEYGRALTNTEGIVQLFPDSGEALNIQGQIHSELENYEAALESIRGALDVNDANPLYQLNAARACLGLERYEEAIEYASAALELNDQVAAALQIRARAHAALSDHENAVDDFTSLLALQEMQTDTLIERGRSYATLGDEDRAIDDLTRAVESAPDNPEPMVALASLYREFDLHADAVDQCGLVLEQFPGFVPALMERALAQQAAGRPDVGLLDLERAIQMDPDNVPLYMRAAEVYAILHDYRSAVSAANSALYLLDNTNPSLVVDILLTKSWYERKRNQPQSSVLDCEQALALTPDNADILVELGRAYMSRDDYEEALERFEAALALDNEHLGAQGALAKYHVLTETADAAGPYVEAVLNDNPNNGEARFLSARLHLNAGQTDDALDELEVALRNGFSTSAEAFEMLVELQRRRGDTNGAALASRALDAIREIQEEPTNVDAMTSLAEALLELDAADEALLVIARQIYRLPFTPEPFQLRGDVYRDLGFPEWAVEEYNEVLALNPNNATVLRKRSSAYRQLGDTESAEADATAAERIESGLQVSNDEESEAPINAEQVSQEIDRLSTQLQDDPDNIYRLEQRAFLYDQLKDHENAIRDYTKLISLNSGKSSYYLNRGQHREALEVYDLALSDYSLAFERAPDNGEPMDRRISLLRALGRDVQADRETAILEHFGAGPQGIGTNSELSNRDVRNTGKDIPRDPLMKDEPDTAEQEAPIEADEESETAPEDEPESEPVSDEESAEPQ